MELSLDQKIYQSQTAINTINAKVVELKAALLSVRNSRQSWNDYYPPNDTASAERAAKIAYYGAEILKYEGLIAAQEQALANEKNILQSLMDQKAVQQQQLQAQASVLAAQANLTPEQLYNLKLEEIKGATQTATEQAKAKLMQTEATEAEKKATQKRYLMIAGIFVVVILGIYVAVKFKK